MVVYVPYRRPTLIIRVLPKKIALPSAAVLALFVESMDIILSAALGRMLDAVVVQHFFDIPEFFAKSHRRPSIRFPCYIEHPFEQIARRSFPSKREIFDEPFYRYNERIAFVLTLFALVFFVFCRADHIPTEFVLVKIKDYVLLSYISPRHKECRIFVLSFFLVNYEDGITDAHNTITSRYHICLLYTSDAADD